MRNFSNQSNNGPKHNSGPRGAHRGPGTGFNREHRSSTGGYRETRESRGGYRGGNASGNRFDNREGRPGGNRRPYGNREGNSYGNRSDRPRHFDRNDRREGRSERPEGGYPKGSSWVEVSGRSVEEAIEEACRRFNVTKNDLKTEVTDEGTKGFLGIGSKPAKVKVALKPSAVIPFAEGVLTRLLRGMSLPDTVKSRKDEDGNIVLNIEGPSSGTLIGRHGHTLDSLQYLVSKVAQRLTGDEKTILIVDVENYLERQKEKLKELALSLADKAKETGTEIPMRPMSSKDRRIVHLTLKDHEHVTTESRGEGLRRRVVVVPKVKAVAPAAGATNAEGATPEGIDPGNVAPPTPAVSEVEGDEPMPGNAIPPEPVIDDNIGNRA